MYPRANQWFTCVETVVSPPGQLRITKRTMVLALARASRDESRTAHRPGYDPHEGGPRAWPGLLRAAQGARQRQCHDAVKDRQMHDRDSYR